MGEVTRKSERVKEIHRQIQPRQTHKGLEQKRVQVCFLLLKLLYAALL